MTEPDAHEAKEVTQAAFARLRGVSGAMVSKWKRTGKLVMTADGDRVLVQESMERLAETLDPARGGDRTAKTERPASTQHGRRTQPVNPRSSKSPPIEEGRERAKNPDYHDAARSEKMERAALLRLERLEREGALVSRRRVIAEAQGRATQAREALMAIPDRLSSQLAAQSDADKVRDMLEAEIRHVIDQLAASMTLEQVAA